MTVRQQVTEALAGCRAMPGSSVLIDIYERQDIPPLTDYYLRPVPEECTVPPGLVNGLALLPVFTNDDWSTIYCIEKESGRFLAIDPEAPWPPTEVFASCHDFLLHLLRVVAENRPEAEINQLKELLRGTGVPLPAE